MGRLVRRTAGALRLQWHHAATGLFLLFGILAGLAWIERDVAFHRAEAEDAAGRVGEVALKALAEQMRRRLEAVAFMQGIATDIWQVRIGGEGSAGDLGTLITVLRRYTGRHHYGVRQVMAIGADGRLAWSSLANQRTVQFAGLEAFLLHREGRRGPYVSLLPAAEGQPGGILFSRPILDPASRFEGLVTVTMDPADIAEDIGQLALQRGTLGSVLRDDGLVLVRSLDGTEVRQAVANPAHLEHFRTAPSGIVRQAIFNGQAMLLAWRRLDGWPLIMVFGQGWEGVDRAMAERRASHHLLLAILATALLAVLTALHLLARARRRARAAERAETHRHEVQVLLDALPSAIYRGAVDAAGNYRRRLLSAAGYRMMEASPAQLDDPAVVRAMLGDDAWETRQAMFRKALQEGEATAAYPMTAPAGRVVWLRDHAQVLQRFPDGGADLVGTLTDVTNERALRARLQAAAKLATLGEMATGLAHELNQPAAAIMLAADLALLESERGADRLPSIQERLRSIIRYVRRTREVIDHFRLFGRSDEAGDGTVQVAQVVRGALEICNGLLKDAQVSVALDVPEDLPPVRGRLVPLEQVLVNLFVNARDAMEETPPAERQLTVSATLDAEAGTVLLRLRDRGKGIPPQQLERLFEPFFTTKGEGKGTGLGLSIAQATLNAAGGGLEVANHPTGGVVATVRLALAPPPAGAHAS